MSRAPTASVRDALTSDIPVLSRFYEDLLTEMDTLEPMWARLEGLQLPLADSFAHHIEAVESELLIGSVDSVPFGMLLAQSLGSLRHVEGRVCSLRIVYTEADAREVGVAEVMLEEVMRRFRERGVKWFDANVLPGHRLAKNFFEAAGFSARHIIMFHEDE
jgi:GNAT superfamily N-acetyltransferase